MELMDRKHNDCKVSFLQTCSSSELSEVDWSICIYERKKVSFGEVPFSWKTLAVNSQQRVHRNFLEGPSSVPWSMPKDHPLQNPQSNRTFDRSFQKEQKKSISCIVREHPQASNNSITSLMLLWEEFSYFVASHRFDLFQNFRLNDTTHCVSTIQWKNSHSRLSRDFSLEIWIEMNEFLVNKCAYQTHNWRMSQNNQREIKKRDEWRSLISYR